MKNRILEPSNSVSKLLSSLIVSLVFLSASTFAQDERVYVDPANYFEMVRVQVLTIDENGNGFLRVELPDCDGCYEDFSFDSETLLETPFGPYSGLEKLPDWDDQYVLVVVGKTDQIVRRVTVN